MITLVALAILAALLWLAGYAIACWIWPFKACRRCEGNGKLRSPSGKAWRRCKRCGGSGGRLRAGRWIYNHLIKMRRDAD